MKKITIELDEKTHEELKKRAYSNLRSMKNELLYILQNFMGASPITLKYEDKNISKNVKNNLFVQK